MENSWFPNKFYLFALGQVFNTDILHVAFCVEVIELDIAGHLRDGQGSVTQAVSTKAERWQLEQRLPCLQLRSH